MDKYCPLVIYTAFYMFVDEKFNSTMKWFVGQYRFSFCVTVRYPLLTNNIWQDVIWLI